MPQPFPIQQYRSLAILLALCLTASACASTTASYSSSAARDISRLKSRSLRIMENAEFPFAQHASAVERLQEDLVDALVRAEARPHNDTSTHQWQFLMDPANHLLGGFLIRWQEEESLQATFIVEARLLVASAFDELALYETQKTGAPR